MKNERTSVTSDRLPSVQGPYSYGVKAGDWIFTSGMIGMNSEGELVGATSGRPDIEAQTRQALNNLMTVLEELGTCCEKVTKVNAYLTDFRYFDEYFNAL